MGRMQNGGEEPQHTHTHTRHAVTILPVFPSSSFPLFVRSPPHTELQATTAIIVIHRLCDCVCGCVGIRYRHLDRVQTRGLEDSRESRPVPTASLSGRVCRRVSVLPFGCCYWGRGSNLFADLVLIHACARLCCCSLSDRHYPTPLLPYSFSFSFFLTNSNQPRLSSPPSPCPHNLNFSPPLILPPESTSPPSPSHSHPPTPTLRTVRPQLHALRPVPIATGARRAPHPRTTSFNNSVGQVPHPQEQQRPAAAATTTKLILLRPPVLLPGNLYPNALRLPAPTERHRVSLPRRALPPQRPRARARPRRR